MDQALLRGRPVPGVGRAQALAAALATWFVLVLLLGAVGFSVGVALAAACEGGLECLNHLFGGALVGALAGALVAAVLARRWMRWWWLPTTLVLLVPGAMLAEVDDTLSIVLVLLAPVVAGLTAVRPGERDEDTGERQPGWWPGLVALGVAAALALGTWFVLERQDRRAAIAEVEAVEALGVELVAPVDRDDLRIPTMTALSGDDVRYTLARGEHPEVSYLDVALRPEGGDCASLTEHRPCERLGDGLSVYRNPENDHWVVYVDLGESHARLSDGTGTGRAPGWTEDEAVQLALELEPVDAAWLVDAEER
ncbi:hypothetical protein [Serinicoccus marinus]|uniref:hypothetical protein n=1 Tax=Serinicoccus marinus TaxID=247333 RepID=UPI00122E949E|nr:hypothetical protein [Serinicoccus marinus]